MAPSSVPRFNATTQAIRPTTCRSASSMPMSQQGYHRILLVNNSLWQPRQACDGRYWLRPCRGQDDGYSPYVSRARWSTHHVCPGRRTLLGCSFKDQRPPSLACIDPSLSASSRHSRHEDMDSQASQIPPSTVLHAARRCRDPSSSRAQAPTYG